MISTNKFIQSLGNNEAFLVDDLIHLEIVQKSVEEIGQKNRWALIIDGVLGEKCPFVHFVVGTFAGHIEEKRVPLYAHFYYSKCADYIKNINKKITSIERDIEDRHDSVSMRNVDKICDSLKKVTINIDNNSRCINQFNSNNRVAIDSISNQNYIPTIDLGVIRPQIELDSDAAFICLDERRMIE